MRVLAWPAFKTKYKNPYNWLLYSNLENLGVTVDEFTPLQSWSRPYDIFHIHWPLETLTRHPNPWMAELRCQVFLRFLDWLRSQGTAIVWTIHDQSPHVLLHPKLAEHYYPTLIKRVDACIHLCRNSQDLLIKQNDDFKALSHFIVPHGDYREIYPNHGDRTLARKSLDLLEDQQVILFLGYISPYKNVSYLAEIFRQLSSENTTLVIAGKPDSEALAQEVNNAAGQDPRIKLHLNFIPDDKLQNYFNAADLVVLPFQGILNSGSTILSLSFNKPVLAPALGAINELQDTVGKEWIQLYHDTLQTNDLIEALHWSRQHRDPSLMRKLMNWQTIAHTTLDIYSKLRTTNQLRTM